LEVKTPFKAKFLYRYIWVCLIAISFLAHSTAFGQTRADLELLKNLAKQQKEKTVVKAQETKEIKKLQPTIVELDIPSTPAQSDHFGYSYFKSSKSLAVLNNLPVPIDYVLGPGDEIVITLWGETELRARYQIRRDNTINVERVGLLNLSGKTLEQAAVFLKGQFEKAYSTLKGAKPRTFIDVSIGLLKSINVKFVGEVSHPGTYSIHPFSTVSLGLMQAGGVALSGSLRDIQVIRGGKIFSTLDLYSFLLEGETRADIRMQDQDIVFIPVRSSDVKISGEIRRPAVYELKPEESLNDLLSFAGGLTPRARSFVEFNRIIPIEERTSEDQVLATSYIDLGDLSNWTSIDGASVIIPEILPENRKISIRGQVKKPGEYTFIDSMRVWDALLLAGGVEDPDFWPSIDTKKGEILRRNPGSDYAYVLPFDLDALKKGEHKENIVLQNYDIIILRRSSYFNAPEKVTILGEVEIPGVYPIQDDGETLESILEIAGGFSERAFVDGVLLTRDNIRVILNDYDFPVFDGDQISVPRKPNTVEIKGEVYIPALIRYKKGLTFQDYIESAGGYTDFANKHKVSVIYPNGDIRVKGWFGSPKVVEGAIILVHKKKESEPFDSTEFLKETASIVASLATIIYIISVK